MLSWISSWWAENTPKKFSVSVAESVTAGALSASLCAKPGASSYFYGSVVCYSIASKKEMLNIDTEYAEKNNFANPYTTEEMAKAVAKKFKSHIGLATTGYSLPIKRDKTQTQCALDVKNPYAYIALYDTKLQTSIVRLVNYTTDKNLTDDVNRAKMQAKVALVGLKMYEEYKEKYSDVTE
jgi:PncC family amidohydrolase